MKRLGIILFLCWGLIAGCAASGTPDPFMAAAQAQRTAVAAQEQAAFYSAQLTATSQAQIVPITATAAAWQMQQNYAAATMQAQQATATAESQRISISATSTAIAVRMVAQQTQVANDLEVGRLRVQSAQNSNFLWSVMPLAAMVLLGFAAMMFSIAGAMRLSKMPIPSDTRGNPQPMFDVVDGKAVDVVPNRTQIMQQIAARTPKALPAPISNDNPSFPLPKWEMMKAWDGKNGLPYGATERGLQLMNIANHPHIATIGKTGSGKSRRFLRPFLAGALAAGYRVIILGKSADFQVFQNQPNAKLITVRDLTNEREAARYGAYLRAMVEEMNRRDAYLTESHHSTWAQAGREQTLLVLDELVNALDMMPKDAADLALRHIRGLANEGRKAGFDLVMASQRAVGLRNLMTQVGRAVFFVQDEQESRLAMGMPGAERLQEGYFYARFGAMQLTGAFAPSDEEITSFLAERAITPLEPQEWIEGMAQPVTSDAAETPKDEISETQRLAESIRGQWSPTMSKNAVAQLLGWKQYGGGNMSIVRDVISYLASSSTSTAENEAKMPVLQAVGA